MMINLSSKLLSVLLLIFVLTPAIFAASKENSAPTGDSQKKQDNSSESIEIAQFATTLPAECRNNDAASFETRKSCVQKYFVMDGKPVNPLVIRELLVFLADAEDQITSINLLGTQDSNRFFLDEKNLGIRKSGNSFLISANNLKQDDNDNAEGGSFAYKLEGITKNRVYIIRTIDQSDGGTEAFSNLLFLRVLEDKKGIKDEGLPLRISKLSSSDKNRPPSTQKISLNNKRLILENLGEIALGTRIETTIKVKDNKIDIECMLPEGKIYKETLDLEGLVPKRQ